MLLPFPFHHHFIIPIDEEKLCSLWKAFFHAFLVSLAIVKFRINRYLFGHAFIFRLGGSHGVGVTSWLISYIGNLGVLLVLGGLFLIYAVIASANTIKYLGKIFSSKRGDESDDDVIDLEDEEATVAVGTEIVPEDWIDQTDTVDLEKETDKKPEEESVTRDDVSFEIEQPVDAESAPVDINNAFGKQDENEDPFYNLENWANMILHWICQDTNFLHWTC